MYSTSSPIFKDLVLAASFIIVEKDELVARGDGKRGDGEGKEDGIEVGK